MAIGEAPRASINERTETRNLKIPGSIRCIALK
jgi:hypothetical protein